MKQDIQEQWDNQKSCTKCVMGIPKEKKDRKDQKKYLNDDWELSKVNDRHQTKIIKHRSKKLKEYPAR